MNSHNQAYDAQEQAALRFVAKLKQQRNQLNKELVEALVGLLDKYTDEEVVHLDQILPKTAQNQIWSDYGKVLEKVEADGSIKLDKQPRQSTLKSALFVVGSTVVLRGLLTQKQQAKQFLVNSYQSTHNRQSYLLQLTQNNLKGPKKVSKSGIETILARRWVGNLNFDERFMREHKQYLDDITRVIKTCQQKAISIQEAKSILTKRVKLSEGRAHTLIMTEHAYLMNEATFDAYADHGVDAYQFVATLDNKTSELCQEMDGKVFKLTDKKSGVNAPPLHPRCRSTTIPHLPGSSYTRRVGKTTENYMTYKEWMGREL